MEQLGPLPGPDTVLNKLKSDGTFDQFRKSCLAAIESEVCCRFGLVPRLTDEATVDLPIPSVHVHPIPP